MSSGGAASSSSTRSALAAMDKGIPLPELPLDPARVRKPPDPKAPLIHGIVWSAFGIGASIALRLLDVSQTPRHSGHCRCRLRSSASG